MKRKILLVALIVMLLLLGYTLLAWLLLRGAGAYRLNTTIGMVLANSWQYTAVISFVFVIVMGFWAVRSLHHRKASAAEDSGRNLPTEPLYTEKTQVLPTDAATALLPKTEKLAPSIPMENLAKTELLPTPDTTANVTRTNISVGHKTSAANTKGIAYGASKTTAEKTQILLGAESSAFDTVKTAGAAKATKSCASCGAALKPEHRFCTRCGTTTEGGEQ